MAVSRRVAKEEAGGLRSPASQPRASLASGGELQRLRLEGHARGEADQPDLGVEGDAQPRLDALARHLHERENIVVRGSAAVDDQVGGLRRDLGAVDTLAAKTNGLNETGRAVARRILLTAARAQEQVVDVPERLLCLLRPALDDAGAALTEAFEAGKCPG